MKNYRVVTLFIFCVIVLLAAVIFTCISRNAPLVGWKKNEYNPNLDYANDNPLAILNNYLTSGNAVVIRRGDRIYFPELDSYITLN